MAPRFVQERAIRVAGVILVVLGLLAGTLPACGDLVDSDPARHATSARSLEVEVLTNAVVASSEASQVEPSISGDLVVYTEVPTDGNLDVRAVGSTGGEPFTVAGTPSIEHLAQVSGDLVVYEELILAGPSWGVLLYDMATESTLPLGESGRDLNPSIDGLVVAWEAWTPAWSPDLKVVVLEPTLDSWTAIDAPATEARETAPAVSGSRVVYERRVTADGDGDIWVFDLDTGDSEPIAQGPPDQWAPDIDGVWVAYLVHPEESPAPDVAFYNLESEAGDDLGLSGAQGPPSVSGGLVVFSDERDGGVNLTLYDARVDELFYLTTGSNTLLDPVIDGNRIAYAELVVRGGSPDFDIRVMTLELREPDIDVTPLQLDFGPVPEGTTVTNNVTIRNLGEANLDVDGIELENGDSEFSVVSPGSLTIGPDGYVDVEVRFTVPGPGSFSDRLRIASNDPDESLVVVELLGASEAPPDMDQILAFYDEAVADRTLVGRRGRGQLVALRAILRAAGHLIDLGVTHAACNLLDGALVRMDGVCPPGDFIVGEAIPELSAMLLALRESLECGPPPAWIFDSWDPLECRGH